jgi:tetratricopeptide (TPR) repeat protein
VVSRLVGLAAGNALFLEELIRNVAEGRGEEPPSSVLAMLQSRLQRLEHESRRVVLAASILGRTFWPGSVRALLEPAFSSEELAYGLRRLVEMEVVQRQPGSRFPSESEYRFHHALVRDAAYSLVPESLRATGHLQAGQWLETAGESEPIVLAEHYKLGGQKPKALHFFTRACKQSCERQRSDLQGAQRCLEAALACGPTGPALTELQVLEADIAFWTDDAPRTISVSNEVLPKLVEGSSAWTQVVGNLMLMNAMAGRLEEAGALGHLLLSIEPAPEATAAHIEALAFLSGMYQWTGQQNLALPLLERQAQLAMERGERDNFAYGWWCLGKGQFDHESGTHLWRSRSAATESMEAFDKAGAYRNQLLARVLLVMVLGELGEMPKAVEVLREGLAKARYFARASNWFQIHAALVLSGSLEPAHQEEARCLALLEQEAERTNPQHLGIANTALARVALAQGSWLEAETWAREACGLLETLPFYEVFSRTCLSAALRCQGRMTEGRAEAEQSVRILERLGGEGAAAVGVWRTLAEACAAQGDEAAADVALRKALECLRLRLEDLPDTAARERFLSQVPDNARVLHMARERSLYLAAPGPVGGGA